MGSAAVPAAPVGVSPPVFSSSLLPTPTSTLQKTRLWGPYLSGTPQGAGGVGGLLSESHISNPQAPIYYPTYDGNGNISEYLTATGTIAAHFEYDPFGNTVVNTDTNNQFTYRFSTKPRDQETGLYYFGYRYYDPMTGRWPSRDPIGEKGGQNLYGFLENDSLNSYDVHGLRRTPARPFVRPPQFPPRSPRGCTGRGATFYTTGGCPGTRPYRPPYVPPVIMDPTPRGDDPCYCTFTSQESSVGGYICWYKCVDKTGKDREKKSRISECDCDKKPIFGPCPE